MSEFPLLPLPVIHHRGLRSPIETLLTPQASIGARRQSLQAIRRQLADWGSLEFLPLENGLFPAAAVSGETEYTGYDSIWVRDNIHVAHAHWVIGQPEAAVKTLSTLRDYFQRHCDRFNWIIAGQASADDPMNRPHIRFNGQQLTEIDQQWAHAQNDALGYFLWLYCKLALADAIQPDADDWYLLGRFVAYFDAIRYWADADSGHWEEAGKVEASSIGAVVAGLSQLKTLTDGRPDGYSESLDSVQVERLIVRGQTALEQILPWECRQPQPLCRRYDGALLFLIYPLGLLQSGEMVQQILDDVAGNLQGKYGIKRYLNDSFWAPDYKSKASEAVRTVDVSQDSSWRDEMLTPGGEAQWCIFDPIMSVIYGQRYQRTDDIGDLAQQLRYLGRALGQVTAEDCAVGSGKCPELYYSENGVYVPNDSTPLLWTQANLAVALAIAEQSLG